MESQGRHAMNASTGFAITLLIGIAGAVGVAATLPLIVELFLLTFAHLLPRRSLRAAPAGVVAVPKIAVIVPAHNEELLIARCVASLKAAATQQTRILVIAHNCTDKTAARALDAGAEVLALNDPTLPGKGYALRYGFEQALERNAEAVLVVDADSTVSPGLIADVETAMANGAEVVQCRYSMTSVTDRANARLAALALRGFNAVRPAGRERLGLSCGILGNGFAIRDSVLRAIPYDALSVVEDLEYHIHLVMAGKRVHYLDQALLSAELPTSKQGEATQRARWEGGRLYVARRWSGALLGQVLRGRLRLLEPLLDVCCLPLAYGAFLLVVLLTMSLVVPLLWLRVYSLIAIGIVAAHVFTAAWLSPERWGSLRLLIMAPIYVLWKLRVLPGLLSGAKKQAAWVRTERDADLGEIVEKPVRTAQ
jgi:cellulose synthase/poly-beta-1,6-N-acetylglucosamine synthase-like glycosyltransferase